MCDCMVVGFFSSSSVGCCFLSDMTNNVNRYDYLEFKDSHGKTVKCDDKVGTSSWPKVLKFTNCSRLQFSFHSDSSGVDWGYKFKVHIFVLAFAQSESAREVCWFKYFNLIKFVQQKFNWCTQSYIKMSSMTLWYMCCFNYNNDNKECICKVQNKWSSDALHRCTGVESFQFPRRCLNRAGRVLKLPVDYSK